MNNNAILDLFTTNELLDEDVVAFIDGLGFKLDPVFVRIATPMGLAIMNSVKWVGVRIQEDTDAQDGSRIIEFSKFLLCMRSFGIYCEPIYNRLRRKMGADLYRYFYKRSHPNEVAFPWAKWEMVWKEGVCLFSSKCMIKKKIFQ